MMARIEKQKSYDWTCPDGHQHNILIRYDFDKQEFSIENAHDYEMYLSYQENRGYGLGFNEPEDFWEALNNSKKEKNCSLLKEYPKRDKENSIAFNNFDQEWISKFKKDVDLESQIITWIHNRTFGKHSVFCSGEPCPGYKELQEQTCSHCQEEWKKKINKELFREEIRNKIIQKEENKIRGLNNLKK